MLNYNSIFNNLEIKKIIFNGFGLAHYQNKSILVYQGITGDNVDVQLVHKRGDSFFAVITNYNRQSKYQIPVKCSSFAECGGCDWLNIAYSSQLKFKQDIFNDIFHSSLTNNVTVNDIIPSPIIDNYRNKIILPVTMDNNNIKTGMYARRSHKVIPHNYCFLHPDRCNDIIKYTEELLTGANCSIYNEKTGKGSLKYIGIRYSETKKNHLLTIVTKSGKLPFTKIISSNLSSRFPSLVGIVQDINRIDSNRNLSSNYKILVGNDFITEDILTTTLQIHYTSFFQINTLQCINVIKAIQKNISANDIVIDAYSGIGTIGLNIAPYAKQVICLESHPQAIQNTISNVKNNKLYNVTIIDGQVENTLPKTLKKYQANTIIVDPPRKGLGDDTHQTICNSSIDKIIYLSCNISTQKRDIDRFIKAGFSLNSLQPFDMFPHTHHIESLAIITK